VTIAFFHQNAVAGVQGGIERYISTLLDQGGNRCVLVSEYSETTNDQVLGLPLLLKNKLPQWMCFVLTIWNRIFSVRSFLRLHKVTAIEFSRPEYAFFSFLLPGKKIFTFHGTGPAPSEQSKYLIHHASCWLLPIVADRIQIIRQHMQNKISTIDAWYDPCFVTTPLPDTTGPAKIFYAGRLAKMKNPELLFAIIRKMKSEWGDKIHFFYFGSDGVKIPPDIRNTQLIDRGLLSAPQLAQAISECHMGILCSGFGEGSPFIIVETLACGRGYILPPLSGLQETYNTHTGIRFAEDYTPAAFAHQAAVLFGTMKIGQLTPQQIADSVSSRSQHQATETLLHRLMNE